MIEQDTIKLLRECDAGVKMGLISFKEIMGRVQSKEMKHYLEKSQKEHEKLQEEIEEQLNRFHDDGKAPNPIAQSMSWVKTNAKLMMDESDSTIADLMIDGCDMGVKSLNRYLNQYQAADEYSKDITKKLIKLEEELGKELRKYL